MPRAFQIVAFPTALGARGAFGQPRERVATLGRPVLGLPVEPGRVRHLPGTLNRLDDAAPNDLSGATGTLNGRADYTWALQWNFTLAPGQSFLISTDMFFVPRQARWFWQAGRL